MIPFRSTERFDDHAIARVFCPICADRAPAEGFLVVVTGVPGWSGIYAIDWNQDFLEEKDPSFRDSEPYYRKLFSSGGVAFGFLPAKHADRSYDFLGIKERLPSDILPRGRAGRIMVEDAATEHPERPARGSRERKHCKRGWKGR
jgi:hypothetical protein